MVMSRDLRGMAVLVDSLLFLAALSVVSAILLGAGSADDGTGAEASLASYHKVMLGAEIADQGSVTAQVTLSSFLVMAAQDGALSEGEMEMLRSASSATLMEMGHMGTVWWEVSLNGDTYVFGSVASGQGDVLADSRLLGQGAVCTLFLQR